MPKKVEIELNSAGVRELLKSAEIEGYCKELAQGVASRAGDGYEVTSMSGKTRANARVSTTDRHSYNSNLKYNTLLKALGG